MRGGDQDPVAVGFRIIVVVVVLEIVLLGAASWPGVASAHRDLSTAERERGYRG